MDKNPDSLADPEGMQLSTLDVEMLLNGGTELRSMEAVVFTTRGEMPPRLSRCI